MTKQSRHAKNETPNFFSWLDEVRESPSQYVQSLAELESMILGYIEALRVHDIVESGPSMGRHFLYWVGFRTRWPMNLGWAHAIEAHVSDQHKQLLKFFRLVDEYRQLTPAVLCTARLTRSHQPTGKRVTIGFDGRMKRPDRVDIVRYVPVPLHFLRFHYPNGNIVDDNLLGRDGYETMIHDAKRWVRDELQVKRHEWQRIA